MSNIQMGIIETKFADIIWDNEPLSSSELARLSEEKIGWKKTTSFTVLKRLCSKGIFKNDRGTVSSIISREEFYSLQSKGFVNDTFSGSLPAFVSAFVRKRSLTSDEADTLRRIIAEHEEK